jgi:hypothetical protein
MEAWVGPRGHLDTVLEGRLKLIAVTVQKNKLKNIKFWLFAICCVVWFQISTKEEQFCFCIGKTAVHHDNA